MSSFHGPCDGSKVHMLTVNAWLMTINRFFLSIRRKTQFGYHFNRDFNYTAFLISVYFWV